MVITGVNREMLDEIAAKMGIMIYEKPRNRTGSIVLRPLTGSDEYRATGRHGRRKWAVTWEGHRDFMQEVFKVNPKAVIRSCKATYNGVESFNAQYRGTYYAGYAL
jgi:hypothetical protein